MLSQLIREEIVRRGLSYRSAAREVGLAHTTLIRIRDGRQVDNSSLVKIASWLGLDFTLLVSNQAGQHERDVHAIALLLEKDPQLSNTFHECIDLVYAGEIPMAVLEDVVRYLVYKLQLYRG